jgi:iron(III) transport system permease protein
MAFTPIAFLVLSGVVRSLDVALEEAAQTLRATPWVLLRTVTGPLLMPGLANAMLLVMIESLADFGNPILWAAARRSLATEVFLAIEDGSTRTRRRCTASSPGPRARPVPGPAALARRRVGRDRDRPPLGGAPRTLPRVRGLDADRPVLVYATMAALLYGSLFLGGFVRVWGIDHTFTTTHLPRHGDAGLPVLLETARLAAIAAVPAALIGFLIAYLTTRHRFLGRGPLEFSALLSYALPGTVMGVGYILAFNQGGFKLTGRARS